MVQTPLELQHMRTAARVSELAMRQTLDQVRIGTPLREIGLAFARNVTLQGCVFDHAAFGPRGLGLMMNPAQPLRDDDVMFLDYGCTCEGYYSDTGITLSAERIDARMSARYELLLEAMAAGERELREGRPASMSSMAMARVLAGQPDMVVGAHGHGLGLEPRCDPMLMPNNAARLRDDLVDLPADLPLERGMVVNLELPLFIPGEASLHIEKTYLVGDKGPSLLVDQQRHEPWRCG